MAKCDLGAKITVYPDADYTYEVDFDEELTLTYVEHRGGGLDRRYNVSFGGLDEVEAVIQALQLALEIRRKINKE